METSELSKVDPKASKFLDRKLTMHIVNASMLVWTLLLLFLFVYATHLHNPFPKAYLTLQLKA